MRNERLEKQINRLDGDIDAMGIAKKYLSNVEDINEVINELNEKRILLANELYFEDHSSYAQCCIELSEFMDKELGQDQQTEVLEMIKDIYGRRTPKVGKKSYGLNAWLKELDIEYHWVEKENADWAGLVITGFGLHE